MIWSVQEPQNPKGWEKAWFEGGLNGLEWTSIDQPTMKDAWYVDMTQFLPLYAP